MRMLHPFDIAIFATDPTPEVRADMGERMRAWAAPYAGELNTTQLDVMYAYKVTGHFGAFLSAATALLDISFPFYLRPAFTAAFSVNHRYRAQHRLMRHMISALDPSIAALPTTNGGSAEAMRLSNAHRFLPYYAAIGRRAITKVSYTTTGRALLAPSDPTSDRIVHGRRHLVDAWAAEGLFDPSDMRTGRLYDRAALAGVLDRARRGPTVGFDVLSRVATAELTLRAADASLDE
jgi:hypothetical protein